jgi:hypothetical protein
MTEPKRTREFDTAAEGRAGIKLRLPRWVRWSGAFWQNVIPLVALILAYLAIHGTESKVDRQAEGRGVAINVLCGGLRGVEDAGVAILKDELPDVPHKAQTAAERDLRQRFAKSYSSIISESVVNQAGRPLENVLEPDGRLNCDRVIRASQAGRTK